MTTAQIAVLIPFVTMRALHEAHARLGKSSREQTLRAEVFGLLLIHTVELLRRIALAIEIHHSRRGGLHAIRKLETLDAPFKRRVTAVARHVLRVEFLQEIKLFSLQLWWQTCLHVFELRTRRRDARVTNRCAVRPRREKPTGEVVHAAVTKCGADGDERGQIVVLRAETIRSPRTHRRTNEGVAARVNLEQCATVRGI